MWLHFDCYVIFEEDHDEHERKHVGLKCQHNNNKRLLRKKTTRFIDNNHEQIKNTERNQTQMGLSEKFTHCERDDAPNRVDPLKATFDEVTGVDQALGKVVNTCYIVL